MDLTKLDSIVHKKLCPKCNLGMVRETAARVYTCDHSKCGKVYDFSCLTDGMLRLLLEPEKGGERRSGRAVKHPPEASCCSTTKREKR